MTILVIYITGFASNTNKTWLSLENRESYIQEDSLTV